MKSDQTVEEGIEIIDDYDSPRLKRIILSTDELDLVSNAVLNVDIASLKDLLNIGGVLGTSSKQQVQKGINRLPQEVKIELLTYFSENVEPGNVQVLGMLTKSLKMWQTKTEEFYDLVESLALEDEWYPREIAAELLGEAILDSQIHVDRFRSYVDSDQVLLRRLAALSARALTRGKRERFEEVLKILEPLMKDPAPHVSSILSRVTIGDRFLKWYPDLTIEWLEKLSRDEDSLVHNSVLQSFAQNIEPDLATVALEFVDKFIDDSSRDVRQMSEQVLIQICKIREDLVSMWLEKNMGKSAVVEHWANLSASGALKSAEFIF